MSFPPMAGTCRLFYCFFTATVDETGEYQSSCEPDNINYILLYIFFIYYCILFSFIRIRDQIKTDGTTAR